MKQNSEFSGGSFLYAELTVHVNSTFALALSTEERKIRSSTKLLRYVLNRTATFYYVLIFLKIIELFTTLYD